MKYEKEEKAKLVKAELNKIKKTLQGLSDEMKKLNAKLIYNAAWLAVSLDELTTTMDEQGVISEYKNGENQYGTKKSPEAELYTNWAKQYQTVMKQLSDLLPKGEDNSNSSNIKEDPLMRFVNS